MHMSSMPGMDMSSMSGMHMTASSSSPAVPEGLAWLLGWLVMSVAMMVPAALPTIRYSAITSLWRRRQRTVALFLTGYLAVWLLFGLLALGLATGIRLLADVRQSTIVAAALVVSALWQLSRWKRRAVRACNRIAPMPLRGFGADRGCLAGGCREGLWCVVACWPLMLAMAAGAAVSPAVMIVVGLFFLVERLAARGTRRLLPATAAVLFGAVAGFSFA
jgi:predicted metal-binding membrane protein